MALSGCGVKPPDEFAVPVVAVVPGEDLFAAVPVDIVDVDMVPHRGELDGAAPARLQVGVEDVEGPAAGRAVVFEHDAVAVAPAGQVGRIEMGDVGPLPLPVERCWDERPRLFFAVI